MKKIFKKIRDWYSRRPEAARRIDVYPHRGSTGRVSILLRERWFFAWITIHDLSKEYHKTCDLIDGTENSLKSLRNHREHQRKMVDQYLAKYPVSNLGPVISEKGDKAELLLDPQTKKYTLALSEDGKVKAEEKKGRWESTKGLPVVPNRPRQNNNGKQKGNQQQNQNQQQ